jgi:predicted GTPase
LTRKKKKKNCKEKRAHTSAILVFEVSSAAKKTCSRVSHTSKEIEIKKKKTEKTEKINRCIRAKKSKRKQVTFYVAQLGSVIHQQFHANLHNQFRIANLFLAKLFQDFSQSVEVL